MLHRIVRTCLPLVLLMIATAAHALNEDTTIVLHAHDGLAPCDDPQQQGVCADEAPRLDLTGMQMPWVFIMLRNFDDVSALQCAFDWPSTWTLLGGAYDCQPGSVIVHQPTVPGPITGTLAVGFHCLFSGELITVGRMIFAPVVGEGCLSIINSGFDHGTYVNSCKLQSYLVSEINRGRVCNGPGGYDACVPASTPVESVTWGAIKGQYR